MAKGARAIAAIVLLAGCGGGGRLEQGTGALDLGSSAIDFGAVALGEPGQRPLTLRNVGRVPLQVSQVALAGPFSLSDFPSAGLALASGESASLTVVFIPSIEGHAQGTLSVTTDTANGPVQVPLTGLGVKAHLQSSGDALAFGSVRVGGARTLTLSLSNDSPVAVSTPVRIEGTDASEYSALAGATVQIGAGGTLDLAVEYRPTHLGTAEATLKLQPCPGCAEQSVSLTGAGIASCIGASLQQIDFGSVDVGTEVSQVVRIVNQGDEPVTLAEAFLASTSSTDFRFDGFAAGQALQPGDSATMTIYFKPASQGPRSGALRVRAGDSADPCWAEVPLKGAGGESCLTVSPAAVDFGEVATGMTARRSVVIENGGCGRDVWVESVAFTGAAEIAAGALRSTPFLLKSNDSVEVQLSFSPMSAGAFRGTLGFDVADERHRPLAQGPAPVAVQGTGRAMAPCAFSATPARIDFGTLQVNARARLAVRFTNLGQDSCFFSDVALTSNSAPSLKMVAASSGFSLAAGASADIEVTFAPESVGAATGALQYYVSDPANPYRLLSIAGNAVDGCLAIEPAELDFGVLPLSCPASHLSTRVSNVCTSDLQLQGLVAGAGTASDFSVQGAPAFPMTLAASGALLLSFQFAPTRDGLASQPMFLDDGTARHLLSLRGVGAADATRTDQFDQPARAKVDVLFVLDNSGSMADKQAAVGANLAAFLQRAIAQQIDYHLAVTTTGIDPSTGGWAACPGGADGGEAGRLFPVDNSLPRIITPATPNVASVWSSLANVGVCHWLEQGLEAASRALTPPLIDHADAPGTPQANDGNLGFLRADARLALVFVSDEDDQSPQGVPFYLSALRALKADPSKVTASAIVTPANLASCPSGTSSGMRYIDMANQTGGIVESICTPDWSASLQRLGDNAFSAPTTFQLSAAPADPAQIVVSVDGVVVPSQGHWHYDAASRSVVFESSAVPGPGAHVEVRYAIGCG